jgi:hypothetical protein
MNTLSIDLSDQKTSYLPGDAVSGAVSWSLDNPPKGAQLRLFWYTKGKGTQDVGVFGSQVFENPKPSDSRSFSFSLPLGPYTFSGKLISLIWALELIIEPHAQTTRQEIMVSPTLQEILLSNDSAA